MPERAESPCLTGREIRSQGKHGEAASTVEIQFVTKTKKTLPEWQGRGEASGEQLFCQGNFHRFTVSIEDIET